MRSTLTSQSIIEMIKHHIYTWRTQQWYEFGFLIFFNSIRRPHRFDSTTEKLSKISVTITFPVLCLALLRFLLLFSQLYASPTLQFSFLLLSRYY